MGSRVWISGMKIYTDAPSVSGAIAWRDSGAGALNETSYVEQRAAFLWIVPAQVAGGWQLRGDDGLALDLDLEQEFQRIKGRAELPAGAGTLKAGLRDPILRGDLLRFELVDRAGHLLGFAGRVSGERMTGSVTGPAGTRTFTATRRPP